MALVALCLGPIQAIERKFVGHLLKASRSLANSTSQDILTFHCPSHSKCPKRVEDRPRMKNKAFMLTDLAAEM
jgi:hypothetical protein